MMYCQANTKQFIHLKHLQKIQPTTDENTHYDKSNEHSGITSVSSPVFFPYSRMVVDMEGKSVYNIGNLCKKIFNLNCRLRIFIPDK